MQARAAEDLKRLATEKLGAAGLTFTSAAVQSTPRRLALVVEGLPAAQPDVREEKRGPRVGSPEGAVQGFLKGAGLTSLEQCEQRDTGKGVFWFAVIEKPGRATAQVLPGLIESAIRELPWPKSMRWSDTTFRWVRPLHSIIATFDGEVVPFAFAGVQSGNSTMGHRFLSQGALTARRFDDYEAALKKAHVILDADQRKAIIFEGVKSAAFVHGLEMIPDEGLLAEVAGLAEYPVVLIGRIEDQFMDVPAEILIYRTPVIGA